MERSIELVDDAQNKRKSRNKILSLVIFLIMLVTLGLYLFNHLAFEPLENCNNGFNFESSNLLYLENCLWLSLDSRPETYHAPLVSLVLDKVTLPGILLIGFVLIFMYGFIFGDKRENMSSKLYKAFFLTIFFVFNLIAILYIISYFYMMTSIGMGIDMVGFLFLLFLYVANLLLLRILKEVSFYRYL